MVGWLVGGCLPTLSQAQGKAHAVILILQLGFFQGPVSTWMGDRQVLAARLCPHTASRVVRIPPKSEVPSQLGPILDGTLKIGLCRGC